jgi:mRNA interferase RelE/StbE
MTYSIASSEEADSDFGYLLRSDGRLAVRILAKVESLADSPREGKPLVGNHKGEFSLRVGNYRIVYEPDSARLTVYILTIKHRKHVYG